MCKIQLFGKSSYSCGSSSSSTKFRNTRIVPSFTPTQSILVRGLLESQTFGMPIIGKFSLFMPTIYEYHPVDNVEGSLGDTLG